MLHDHLKKKVKPIFRDILTGIDFNYGYKQLAAVAASTDRIVLHPKATVYYYKSTRDIMVGSENAWKISQMLKREWGLEVVTSVLPKTTYDDFYNNLHGDLHNAEWLG